MAPSFRARMRLIFWNASAPVCELQDSARPSVPTRNVLVSSRASRPSITTAPCTMEGQSGLEFCAERTIAASHEHSLADDEQRGFGEASGSNRALSFRLQLRLSIKSRGGSPSHCATATPGIVWVNSVSEYRGGPPMSVQYNTHGTSRVLTIRLESSTHVRYAPARSKSAHPHPGLQIPWTR
jgi:hypothetical protein